MSRAMNNSGIPWIGEIPSHWGLYQTSTLFHEHKEKNVGLKEKNLLSLSYGQIKRKDINTNEGLLPQSFETYNVVEKGDIVFRLTDLQNDKRSLRTGLCKERGIITSAYVSLRANTDIDTRYFHYLYHSYDICKVFYGLGDGVRQGMNYDDLRKLLVFLPPLTEQQTIADFLDVKCGEIDEMVSLQERIIEELKAYKQSVITEAVCRGLNPDVPMKDSGIEWEGEVPRNWQKVFLKWFFSFEKGKNAAIYTADYIGQHEGCYAVYSGQTENEGVMGRIDTFDYDIEECLFTTTVGGKVMTPRLLHGKFSLSQNCLIMKKKGVISNHFIYYLLIALFAYEKSLIPSYMQPSLRIEDLKTYTFFFFHFNEQQAIADYLDTKCTEIDTLISLKQSKIDALKEYKKSIIYEYITGKKEVEA